MKFASLQYVSPAMTDQSALDKEATNFALSTGNAGDLELIRLSWEACAQFLRAKLASCPTRQSALELIDQITDSYTN